MADNTKTQDVAEATQDTAAQPKTESAEAEATEAEAAAPADEAAADTDDGDTPPDTETDTEAETVEAPPAEAQDAGGAPAADETADAEEPAEDEEEAKTASEEESEQQAEHRTTIEALLKAGAHFGHLTSRWHPRMEDFIFMDRNNIHIIDLMQTQVLLDRAADAARRFAQRGKEILFVGTKKQAQEIVRRHAEACEQPFMTQRWLGGTMTNFQTMQRSIRRMENLERMEEDGTLDKLKKKERLIRLREHDKLESTLGGIRNMARLPGAIYVVDIKREHIAVSEANKLGIPVIAMVDTNCDPRRVNHPIPANDDALSSIELITSIVAHAVAEGQSAHEAKKQGKKEGKKG